MRRAFEWTFQQIEDGKSRRSILQRLSQLGHQRKTVKEAYKKLDKMRRFDEAAFSKSTPILGVDEVGRGPLAGPLVAVCVQLPYPANLNLPFLRDSKKLQADERESLCQRILDQAVQVGYGIVQAAEFGGNINLHHLTFLAMSRALEEFHDRASEHGLLVDGKYQIPTWNEPQQAVIKGDDISLSIAAASVVAKVYRDSIMQDLHVQFPVYGFDRHVGYGTLEHREALLKHGPTPAHRTNFISKLLAR